MYVYPAIKPALGLYRHCNHYGTDSTVIMNQYYVLTREPQADRVYAWIRTNDLQHEVHLNRIRFWLPPGSLTTEFALRFLHLCEPVEEQY